ncbi:MAG: hypothetical protein GW914_00275 [Candidatus Aenigmarchaeota archaeon]|nr:hypothetical protein [Candidatus Aenigmarchaeota archaeon]NCO97163.1 hypothetical protein [Candidatus Aenigmarchaeota archaeon]
MEEERNHILIESSLYPSETFNQFSWGVLKMPKSWEDDEEETNDEDPDMDNEGDDY